MLVRFVAVMSLVAALALPACSDDASSVGNDSGGADSAIADSGASDTAPGQEGLPKPDGTSPDAQSADGPVIGPDFAAGANLAGSATVAVSFNDNLKAFLNDGVKEGDKPTCSDYYYWFSKFPRTDDKWIELSWSTPVTIASVAVDTIVQNGTPHANCNASDAGRTFGGQAVEIQVDDGQGGWKKVADVDGKSDDWTVSFTATTTSKLRLLTTKAVQLTTNPIVFEVEVFAP